MPIPRTREELVEQIASSYSKLRDEIQKGGPDLGDRVCVDDWTVKELLAIRLWWSERVVEWIEKGERGEEFSLPAPGFKWNETPRLNQAIAQSASDDSYEQIGRKLDAAFERIMELIERLDDTALLTPGVFPWAGKWPVSRWLSINTVRQYATARTYIRKASKHA